MQSLIKSRARLYTMIGVLLFTQCCCCILPVGWQIYRDQPAVQQTVERIEQTISGLPAISTWIASR